MVNESKVKEIQQTLHIHIKRYEQALNAVSRDNLATELVALQKDYSCFLGENPTSPENIEKVKNYLQDRVIEQLYKDVQMQYPDLSDMEKEFNSAFALLKYHFPQAKIPQVYTVISGLYYEMPIIYGDSILAVSLDLFLGKDYPIYKRLAPGVPQYILYRFSKEYIIANCFKEISYEYVGLRQSVSLLEYMITEGKRLLFAEAMLPTAADSVIFPCPEQKLQWAIEHEADVWGYLIEKGYLYSRDNVMMRKLLYDAPFTNLFGTESPGAIGVWIGWQICRAWIRKHPDKPLSELISEDDVEKILIESKYKPKQ
jgi:hypothetical protein